MPERDIFRNYGYVLELGGERAGYFTKVTGMGLSVESIEYREGGARSGVRKLPGRLKVAPVTLYWGVTSNRDMWEWLMTAVNGRVERRNISVIVLGTDGLTEVVRWNLGDVWISEWIGTELEALGNGVAIERMTLQAETVERAADVQAPAAADNAAA